MIPRCSFTYTSLSTFCGSVTGNYNIEVCGCNVTNLRNVWVKNIFLSQFIFSMLFENNLSIIMSLNAAIHQNSKPHFAKSLISHFIFHLIFFLLHEKKAPKQLSLIHTDLLSKRAIHWHWFTKSIAVFTTGRYFFSLDQNQTSSLCHCLDAD